MQIRIATAALMLALSGTAYAQMNDAQKDTAPAAQADTAKKADEVPSVLAIGDKAPALSINKWVKGEPVTSFQKGNVYVVEFWATWCGPCRKSIPHLTEIQSTFKGKGVTVIGVSSGETNGLADVEPFVKKMGDKMVYTVAFDEQGQTSKAWMEASGQEGIPTSFIVNQEGRIAWIGHPMAGLDEVLAKVVDKSFDLDKAAADAKKASAAAAAEAKRMAEIESKLRPLMGEVRQNMQSGDYAKVVESLDKVIAIDPVLLARHGYSKFNIMLVKLKDYDGAYKYGSELVSGPAKDNAEVLNAVSWLILDQSGLERRDFPLAKRAAARANELTAGKDPAIMDTYARALFDSGETEKAIQLQTKAVELAPEGEMKDELKERLDEYQKKVKKG